MQVIVLLVQGMSGVPQSWGGPGGGGGGRVVLGLQSYPFPAMSCKVLLVQVQEELKFLEANEDRDASETEDLYAGGGQLHRRDMEHFPQLWCDAGSYNVYGQV